MANRKLHLLSVKLASRTVGACVAIGIALSGVSSQAAAPRLDQRALSSAFKSAASSDRQLAAFYKARNYRPIWFDGPYMSRDADRLLDLIVSADLDGLDPDEYRPRRLIDAFEDAARGNPKHIARAEMLLSRTLVQYARDLRRTPNTGMVYVDKALAPAPRSAAETLRGAAASTDLIAGGLGLNPLYMELRDGFMTWHERWGSLPQVHVPAGPSMTIGAKGDRVRRLRERLGLSAEGSFDKSVAAAVGDFQATHGLPRTAVADAKTVQALNLGPQMQEAKLRLNLERARALPTGQRRYVLVDAAAQRLSMYQDGKVVDSMRVIVGRPTEPTPMLAALIRFTVLNPYWNVPPDLVQTRIAPSVLKQGIRYLKSERYEILSDWSDDAKPVNPSKVDWKAVASGRVELPMRQLPGRANSMGAMKFMFPNDFGVYLHDTPEKKLFGLADRRKSAGCVRLEDAPRLARWLYGKVPTTGSSKPEQAVPLPNPVPVYITYLTAVPSNGSIVFRDDIYGRDQVRLASLASRSVGD